MLDASILGRDPSDFSMDDEGLSGTWKERARETLRCPFATVAAYQRIERELSPYILPRTALQRWSDTIREGVALMDVLAEKAEAYKDDKTGELSNTFPVAQLNGDYVWLKTILSDGFKRIAGGLSCQPEAVQQGFSALRAQYDPADLPMPAGLKSSAARTSLPSYGPKAL